MTQSDFESPLMPRELADVPDIENVPAASSMHTLMGAFVDLHQEVREMRAEVGNALHAARPATSGARGAGRAQAAAQRALDEQRAAGTPPNLTLGERIRLAAEGPNVPYSTRSYLERLATDADTLTRVGERLVAAAQPDPDGGVDMTTAEWEGFTGSGAQNAPQGSASPLPGIPGGPEGATGAPGGAGEVGLGDALRAIIPATYTDDGYFGVTALEIGQFAERADALERDLDATKEQAEANATTAGDWQARWNDEVHGRRTAEAQVRRVRAVIDDDSWLTELSAERLRAVLDGTQ
jgi:hypothetical protein